MTKLFHVEKFMPTPYIEEAKEQQKALNINSVVLSRHIQNHLDGDCYKHSYTKEGLFDTIKYLSKSPQEPFEIETMEDMVTKYVVRVPYDSNRDISVAVRGNLIVTAWLNNIEDTHRTLDLTKYVGEL